MVFRPASGQSFDPVHVKGVPRPRAAPPPPVYNSPSGFVLSTEEEARALPSALPDAFGAPLAGLSDLEVTTTKGTACELVNFIPTDGGLAIRPGLRRIIGSPTVVPDRVTISGRTVTIRLSGAVTDAHVVRLAYARGENPIQDAAGNDAAAFSNRAVTNNTPAS